MNRCSPHKSGPVSLLMIAALLINTSALAKPLQFHSRGLMIAVAAVALTCAVVVSESKREQQRQQDNFLAETIMVRERALNPNETEVWVDRLAHSLDRLSKMPDTPKLGPETVHSFLQRSKMGKERTKLLGRLAWLAVISKPVSISIGGFMEYVKRDYDEIGEFDRPDLLIIATTSDDPEASRFLGSVFTSYHSEKTMMEFLDRLTNILGDSTRERARELIDRLSTIRMADGAAKKFGSYRKKMGFSTP
jgi:hypothetical protein